MRHTTSMKSKEVNLVLETTPSSQNSKTWWHTSGNLAQKLHASQATSCAPSGAKRNFTQSVLGSMTLKPKREKKYIVQVVNLQKVKNKNKIYIGCLYIYSFTFSVEYTEIRNKLAQIFQSLVCSAIPLFGTTQNTERTCSVIPSFRHTEQHSAF